MDRGDSVRSHESGLLVAEDVALDSTEMRLLASQVACVALVHRHLVTYEALRRRRAP